jgi:ribosomal RNA-processing protein 1
VPASLTFHLAEIYLEELEKAVSASDSSVPVPILALLSPFIFLAAHTPTNTTYKHLEESLFRPLFAALRSHPKRVSGLEYPAVLSNACADVPYTDDPMPHSTLRDAILQKLFAVASAEDTRDTNRRKMYALYKTAVEDDDDSVG